MNPVLSARLKETIERAVDAGETAGANVLVLRRGEELAYAEAGLCDLTDRRLVRRDTIFRLYSQTKPITAAAVMLLVERGVLDLAQFVSDFLPGFRNPQVRVGDAVVAGERPPLLGELLSMTAGLSYPGEDAATAELFRENEALIREGGGMDTVTFCNRMGEVPLAFAPGTQFRYSTCADVLGAVIEVADGRPFARFLREEFFEPLGMKDTAFWVPEEKRSRFAACAQRVDGGVKPWSGIHLAVGDYSREPAFSSGGAGLVSTLDDYAAFATMLMRGGEYKGRRILSRRTVENLIQPQLSRAIRESLWWGHDGYSYGHLMRVCVEPGRAWGLARAGEYGWDGWLGTYFANFPDLELTFLLGQNLKDAGTTSLTRKCRNLAIAAVQ